MSLSGQQKEPPNSLPIDHVTRTAAHLSLIEIALGSVVHGLKLPFAGHTLSLNQGAFLTKALGQSPGRIKAAQQSIEISSVTSLLKSLSPAGNKIGPMLSIAMQGVLYSIGILTLGRGLLGQMLAMTLLSLWAFLQPLLTLFMIHGLNLEKILGFYWVRITEDLPRFSESLGLVLMIIVGLKIVIAMCIPMGLRFLSPEQIDGLENRLIEKGQLLNSFKSNRNLSPLKGTLKDLTQPLFLFSMILVMIFVALTETSWVRIFWLSLRPLAIGFVIFYLIRSPQFLKFLSYLALKNKYLKKLYARTLQSQKYLQTLLSK